MTIQQIVALRNESKKRVQEFQKKENEKLRPFLQLFIDSHTTVKKDKVYELKNPNPRKKYRRIVIYAVDVLFFGEDHCMIRAAGWWLDQNNVPAKWDTMVLYGTDQRDVLIPSKNQIHHPHPDAKQEHEPETVSEKDGQ